MLRKEKEGERLLDVVVDSGGGDILGRVSRVLKPGGRVVVYGMYVSSLSLPLFINHSPIHLGLRHRQ